MRNPWFVKKTNNVNEFHELIESHVDGMYGVALRYTRNPQRAEDLVHDTVVRALRFEDRFEIDLWKSFFEVQRGNSTYDKELKKAGPLGFVANQMLQRNSKYE